MSFCQESVRHYDVTLACLVIDKTLHTVQLFLSVFAREGWQRGDWQLNMCADSSALKSEEPLYEGSQASLAYYKMQVPLTGSTPRPSPPFCCSL